MGRWIFRRRHRQLRPTGLDRELARDWLRSGLQQTAAHDDADGTTKLVLRTADGHKIESVVIPCETRHTLCVSSQVGCSLDCTFCATALLGLGRNLRADEIVDQVLYGARAFAERGQELRHIVFMGMGEPLLNLPSVIEAIQSLVDPAGVGFPQRNITVSTAGVVPRIAELGEKLAVQLAISLHATTDAVRDELVPLNRKFPLEKLLAACKAYPRGDRRRMTVEYCLIRDVNDSGDDARRLGRIVRSLHAKANIIPLNEHEGTKYRRPDAAGVERFMRELSRTGAKTSLRQTRGDDIYAACGQLGAVGERGADRA